MTSSKVLSGLDTAAMVYESLNDRIKVLTTKGVVPGLCVVIVGEDPASKIYIRKKSKKLKSLGLVSETIRLDADVTEQELLLIIEDLNANPKFHGILVQLPLPKHINSQNVINSINPTKDVDGFHPENVGWLSIGKPRFIPCTPKGIMRIFSHYNIDLTGKDIVVIGRSNIVGRPMSILVSSNNANGTCTICHSRTKNINDYSRSADVIISAIGVPNFLTSEMIKEDSIIIDVGINRIISDSEKGYKIVGDVNYDSVFDKVSKITPVPGGVGPMTIAMLVENTIEAAENIQL
tara:strand:+ start:498 stop:1373 length:876 start_codon:yes stop_codon:yes gene_type:complete